MDDQEHLRVTQDRNATLELVWQPDVVLVAERQHVARRPRGRLHEVQREPEICRVTLDHDGERSRAGELLHHLDGPVGRAVVADHELVW